MSVKGFKSHPYIPNSVPEVEQEMLREIGDDHMPDFRNKDIVVIGDNRYRRT